MKSNNVKNLKMRDRSFCFQCTQVLVLAELTNQLFSLNYIQLEMTSLRKLLTYIYGWHMIQKQLLSKNEHFLFNLIDI